MLRLWPETIYVGLFPGQCWLQDGRIQAEPSLPLAQSSDPLSLLRALETMLDDKASVLRKGSRLAISVSDSVAAATSLPWQEELLSPKELHAYAQACFEKQDVTIDEKWVMRAEFRQHRSTGLAYALPQAWLTALVELVGARGLQLSRVLPVSAAAYCAQTFTQKEGRTLVLLREARRIGALVYGENGFLGCDVEPITTSNEISGVRLLRRISACYDDIRSVHVWSAELTEQIQPADYILTCLEQVEVHNVCRGAWS